MAYLNQEQLNQLGLRHCGRDVKISDRASIYDASKISIGDNSRIDDFCVVSGNVEIGRNVHITPQCLVAGGIPGIMFEDFTTIAYQVMIFTQSDDYSGDTMTNSTIPAQYKNEVMERITLGKFSIVGAGSIIMPGASLAEGTSVGAGSLLTKPTTPWGIYVGRPAKRLKDRSRKLLEHYDDYMSTQR